MRSALVVVVAGLAGCPKQPDGPDPEEVARQKAEIQAGMRVHFENADKARYFVTQGLIPAAVQPAEKIGLTWPIGEVPPAWLTFEAPIKEHAWNLENALNIEEAGIEVARLAATCGSCHSKTGGGPDYAVGRYPPPAEDTVADRMKRHEWASDRMWQGLVVANEGVYREGAQVMGLAPLWRPEGEEEALPEPIRPMEAAVRDLARQASAATDEGQRVAIYGKILATCSTCHQIRDTLRK